MPENKGYYQKFDVTRKDGKPIEGRTFTLLIDTDPFAPAAMKAYRDAAEAAGGYDDLVAFIDGYLAEKAD